MGKTLVAYFSASGATKKLAQTLADALGADLFAIEPKIPYTKADLNWTDKQSRSTIEMQNPASRPALAGSCTNIAEYDTVFVADGWNQPDGLCLSAWQSMSPFVLALASGGEGLYDGWMKNPRSAMISCNDGFRPVSFLLETIDA